MELYNAGELKTGGDYVHAALILQHAETPPGAREKKLYPPGRVIVLKSHAVFTSIDPNVSLPRIV